MILLQTSLFYNGGFEMRGFENFTIFTNFNLRKNNSEGPEIYLVENANKMK